MLSESDVPIESAIKAFANFGVEATYFVPTPTGMDKSIFDAHGAFRTYLKLQNIHDFSIQGLGNEEHGRKLMVRLLEETSATEKTMSLYRPQTKAGDPRFWINLRDYAKPYNLIALIATASGEVNVVNCSRRDIMDSIAVQGSPLNSLLTSSRLSPTAEGLIEKLRDIASKGWVPATKVGDTGIGHTLETLLGIDANSSKRPDYLDEIEIKSSRRPPTGLAKNRSTLLSKVPNWKKSALRAPDILARFGSVNALTNRQELYVTVAEKPNRQGLYLVSIDGSEILENRCLSLANGDSPVVQWDLADLQRDISQKHKETFWVHAESRISSAGGEEFRYRRVMHTRRPLVGNLGPLINSGVITMDYTLSDRGNGLVRDHGYLFKIWPKDLGLLFPSVETYELA